MPNLVPLKFRSHAIWSCSNGIRFSIFDVSPATARILPTIYQDRCTISLYDAQLSCGHKIPIPESVIDDVLTALLRFKDICQNLGVADSNIRLVSDCFALCPRVRIL